MAHSAGRIAFVGADGQVHVTSADGSGARAVTFAKVPTPLTRWGSPQGRDTCTWPVWSPDGRWIGCFQSPLGEDHGGPALVVAVEADGVEEQALLALEGELPIYAQWNATGDRLAVLTQNQDELALAVCSIGDLGGRRTVDEGAPLFFAWAGDRILVHVGSRPARSGHVMLRDPMGGDEDRLLAEAPGTFCTPLVVEDQALYVEAGALWSVDVRRGGRRELQPLDGLVAMVARPRHAEIAIGVAPVAGSEPYRGVALLDLGAGSIRTVLDEPCLAFFFDPLGERLLYVKAQGRGQGVTLHVREPSGEVRPLGRFWPSAHQLFYLQFFEQYCASHPLVSPDGAALVFSGFEDPSIAGRDASPRIFAMDLRDEVGLPQVIAEGSFAVWSR
jgi:hypothetical protein